MCGKRTWWADLAFLAIIVATAQLFSVLYVKLLMYSSVPAEAMRSLAEFDLKHIMTLICNILMGMIFGIESLWKQHKSPGRWKTDVLRLLIIGLPLLFISIQYFGFHLFNSIRWIMLLTVPAREPFIRFFLGYIIITSFYKREITPDAICG